MKLRMMRRVVKIKRLIAACIILSVLCGMSVHAGAFTQGQSKAEPKKLTKTIYDIKNWNHPVKKIFEELDYSFGKLERVELYDNNTYPVFYLKIEYWDSYIDNLSRNDFYTLIGEAARGNGYWSYEIRDTENRITIKVVCDRKNKKVSACIINGYPDLKAFLLAERDKGFNGYLRSLSFDKLKEALLCSEDLNGDGVGEGILEFEEKLYLVSSKDGKAFTNMGRLVDNYCVGHVYTGVDIRSLDKTDKKYIVVDIAHDAAPASGYFIYDYDGYLPECILVNFPGATAYGRCELTDYDKDGIEDNVRYYDYIDVQQHSVIEYTGFTSGITKTDLKYSNEAGKFFYPTSPEDVIRAYVEAACMVKEAEFEREYFVSNKNVKNTKLGFEVNTLTYMEIELDIKKLQETKAGTVYEVSEELFEGNVKARFHMKKYDGKWKIESIIL